MLILSIFPQLQLALLLTVLFFVKCIQHQRLFPVGNTDTLVTQYFPITSTKLDNSHEYNFINRSLWPFCNGKANKNFQCIYSVLTKLFFLPSYWNPLKHMNALLFFTKDSFLWQKEKEKLNYLHKNIIHTGWVRLT